MFLDKFLRKCNFRYETFDFQTLVSLLRYNLREASPKYEKLTELNQQFNDIKRNFLLDTMTYQDYKITENEVVSELKIIIDSLRENDLRRKANAIHREIKFPVFVLSESAEKVEENVLLFNLLNFTKKEVIFATEYQETEADIVVFDNQNTNEAEVENRLKLMIEYIENKKYIIHFGDDWESIKKYPNQIFWAKNKVELNTRLDEVVKFIDTYRT